MKTPFVNFLHGVYVDSLSSCKKNSLLKEDPMQKTQAAIDRIRQSFFDPPRFSFPFVNLLTYTPTLEICVSSVGKLRPQQLVKRMQAKSRLRPQSCHPGPHALIVLRSGS